ncbi:MAG: hypothetical protein HOL58_03945 [Francisellaceae bacterium]|jgi:hypothetical protein|nr:hypothetical protein [Francisellaceae bacterium]
MISDDEEESLENKAAMDEEPISPHQAAMDEEPIPPQQNYLYDVSRTQMSRHQEPSLDDLVDNFSSLTVLTNSTSQGIGASLDQDGQTCYEQALRQHSLSINQQFEGDLVNIRRSIPQTQLINEDKLRHLIFPIRAYEHCLKLDIDKWKEMASSKGTTIPTLNININEFRQWQDRTPPLCSSRVSNISGTRYSESDMVIIAFNYWQSCYNNLSTYEQVLGYPPQHFEKHIWELEQTALHYRSLTCHDHVRDINQIRLPEPQNADPATQEPIELSLLVFSRPAHNHMNRFT